MDVWLAVCFDGMMVDVAVVGHIVAQYYVVEDTSAAASVGSQHLLTASSIHSVFPS